MLLAPALLAPGWSGGGGDPRWVFSSKDKTNSTAVVRRAAWIMIPFGSPGRRTTPRPAVQDSRGYHGLDIAMVCEAAVLPVPAPGVSNGQLGRRGIACCSKPRLGYDLVIGSAPAGCSSGADRPIRAR